LAGAAALSRGESAAMAVPAAMPQMPALKELPSLTVAPGGMLWPLVLFNRVFDACLAPLGAPGRWLRGQAGRTLLGAVGLTCIAAAVLIVAMRWFGWTW
jgi:hypothetical protein